VDSLWFESLGFESVFWYRLTAQGLVFLLFGAASAAALYVLFRLAMPPAATPKILVAPARTFGTG
jgi:uncharacterized membrane protein (UPF0182 family)